MASVEMHMAGPSDPAYCRYQGQRNRGQSRPVFLGEAVEQLHSALQHAVPVVVGGILKIEIAITGPLVE